MAEYLEIGRIASTHGLQGEVNVDLWCDGIKFASQFGKMYLGAEKTEHRIFSCRGTGSRAVIKGDFADGIDAAKSICGKILYFDRAGAVLPEGRCFRRDLIGLDVTDADSGKVYGKLTDVLESVTNDLFEMTDYEGRKWLFPAIPQFVISTDLAAGRICVRPIPGLFSDED